MEITLKLTIDEVNFITSVLGDLPSKSGSWPLIVKIKEQGDPQFLAQEQEKANQLNNQLK
jgi:hypothetical protein